MIACCCTGATDRDIRACRKKAGKCGGCAPTLRGILAALPRCSGCGRPIYHRPVRYLIFGQPLCWPCASSPSLAHLALHVEGGPQ